MVKPAEAEKNLAWEAAQAAKAAAPADVDLATLGLGDIGLPLATAAVTAAPAVPAGPLRLQVSGFKQGLGENEIRQIFEPFGALDSVSVVRDAAGQPLSVAYVVFRSGVDGTNAMTHWHGQSLLDHVLTVTATALDAAAEGPGPAVGVGELDDDDGGLKINAQVCVLSTPDCRSSNLCRQGNSQRSMAIPSPQQCVCVCFWGGSQGEQSGEWEVPQSCG